MTERTTVGIVGAGPAGLVLSHLLARAGVENVVLELHDRAYVESRVRAGVLEQCTVELLDELGVTDRLHREGLVHHGVNLQFGGQRHRIDFAALTGRSITVYGQQEVVKDLIAARLAAGGDIRFEVASVKLKDIERGKPSIEWDGGSLTCDFIAGCDGFHGVSRPTIPDAALRMYEHEYPFAWLGILASVAPSSSELVYSSSDRGFALLSARSPTVSRCYLQVGVDEDLAQWPDDRIWEELQRRTAIEGWVLQSGPILEKGITAMRSFVCEPMQYGRLFLAGDAAHIVPPTGAKGMNLAIADVKVLAEAIVAWLRDGDAVGLDQYSQRCLERVWRAQDFAAFMTTLMHLDPDADPFTRRLQRARQRYVVSSEAMSTSLAENYVGLRSIDGFPAQ
jgi:p-hydroxybenzoate 3-monooxygenase